MGRTQVTLSIVVSAVVLVLGVYWGLTKDGTDASGIGWFLAFVGAAGLAVNLVLRGRMR
jgi:hypothetical protein